MKSCLQLTPTPDYISSEKCASFLDSFLIVDSETQKKLYPNLIIHSSMAMSGDSELLREISRKLSQLIVLSKLSNSTLIQSVKEEIRKDSVAQAAIDLADGFLTSSQIKEKVAAQTKVSEKTVERRTNELVEKGVLIAMKRGKEVYYSNSGLYD